MKTNGDRALEALENALSGVDDVLNHTDSVYERIMLDKSAAYLNVVIKAIKEKWITIT